ncbi:protein translocase subunit SecF, partial [Candidatus Dependentiae bacterium]|nr:protein translocase subunit SecF [Candidatus Dependentiae bacterium]
MIDFLRYRYICAAFSLFIVIALIVGYWYRGGFNYSVEFTGGTQVLLHFDRPVTADTVREALKESDHGWKSISVAEFGPQDIRVRVQDFADDVEGLATKLRDDVAPHMPEGTVVTVAQSDSVGSSVGDSLAYNSVKAIIIALLLMLLYIALRFQFAYAVGAIIAVAHDALVIGAIFVLFNWEISMEVIGAILATLGYSVNDTIIIFARIRENLAKNTTMSAYDVVNLSINQTLTLTI